MNNPITGYQSLADEDYKMLAYVSSLKGLLKPFMMRRAINAAYPRDK
ncbi:hypothetical protein ACQLT9_005600 [Salmonella enterica subsp. diarizonae]